MPGFSALTDFLNNLISEYPIPGCDIVVQQNHCVLFRKQFGFCDIQARKPVSGTERYLAYSCTKPLTVAGAMRLIEEEKLGLDDPVKKYLPEFENIQVEENGVFHSPVKEMTVGNLLTMTSGFNYDFQKPPFRKFAESDRSLSAIDFANAAAQTPLIFDPGERFQYGISHDILGAVIEVITGCSLSEYQRKTIFAPLHMTQTDFISTARDITAISPLYSYHQTSKTVEKETLPQNYDLYSKYDSGGAGLVTTVDDYAIFADTLANSGTAKNGYQLLKPETIQMIQTEQLHTYARNRSFSCAAGPGYSYGLGVRTLVDKSDDQRSPIGEFGWDGAAGAYLLVDTQHQLSIFFATHLLNWPALLGIPHAQIRDFVYGELEIE